MAKKKASSRRRSFGVAKTVRRYTSGGGKMAPLFQGAMAGLAAQIGSRFVPSYGGLLGMGAVGYYTGNPTILTMTGMNAANLIPIGGLLGGGGNGSPSGGAI
jgi:hypothetical protein